MGMQFRGRPTQLKTCPECGSDELEVAVYGEDDIDPEPPQLECLGCSSVICRLTREQALKISKRINASDDPLEG